MDNSQDFLWVVSSSISNSNSSPSSSSSVKKTPSSSLRSSFRSSFVLPVATIESPCLVSWSFSWSSSPKRSSSSLSNLKESLKSRATEDNLVTVVDVSHLLRVLVLSPLFSSSSSTAKCSFSTLDVSTLEAGLPPPTLVIPIITLEANFLFLSKTKSQVGLFLLLLRLSFPSSITILFSFSSFLFIFSSSQMRFLKGDQASEVDIM